MVFKFYIIILLSITLTNCNDRSDFKSTEIMKTVNYVDLEKYMGDWYVIANIPTFIEKNATNAIESYKLSSDGLIHTTFSFYKGSPEGEKKIYKGEWKDELATYEEQQRSERTVIEEHLARVSHRLIILEETVITEQESSLKALEAILTAAKNRKQRNVMVENEGDQSLV